MNQAESSAASSDFSQRLLTWFDDFGRHDLPWQNPRTPYRVWISEIMLQQTQVTTVVPYFQRFMEIFPDVQTLAAADTEAVLSVWAGLGYYQRAKNLHSAAKAIILLSDFPKSQADWQKLPGIGRSTAAAIVAQSFGEKAAILDANVKRVLQRFYALLSAKDADLWPLAESLLPQARLADYSQALMDLGATVCRPKQPTCLLCPLMTTCQAYAQGRAQEIPAKKNKVLRPERWALLVLLQKQGHWLLEKRPSLGIWSNLWSFPLLFFKAMPTPEAEKMLLENFFAQAPYQAYADTLLWTSEALPDIRHDFTHFRLWLKPLIFTLPKDISVSLVQESNLQWFSAAAWPQALPAPLAKLTRILAKKFA
jgi:A/G-specific adenine glycosylase